MKKKIILKPLVKATLLLLPEMLIIVQLFFVGQKLNQLVRNTEAPTVIIETRCEHE